MPIQTTPFTVQPWLSVLAYNLANARHSTKYTIILPELALTHYKINLLGEPPFVRRISKQRQVQQV